MSNKNQDTNTDNVVNVDFGVKDQEVEEVTEEQIKQEQEYLQECCNIGYTVLGMAGTLSKEDFLVELAGLYDIINPPEKKSVLEVPKSKIILPN